jgi:hypothetical protein
VIGLAELRRARPALASGLLVVALALMVAGCAKKGQPQPPPDEPSDYPRTYPRE